MWGIQVDALRHAAGDTRALYDLHKRTLMRLACIGGRRSAGAKAILAHVVHEVIDGEAVASIAKVRREVLIEEAAAAAAEAEEQERLNATEDSLERMIEAAEADAESNTIEDAESIDDLPTDSDIEDV